MPRKYYSAEQIISKLMEKKERKSGFHAGKL